MSAWLWSNCEEISHVQGQRRSPSRMVGGAKSHLESNPFPARDAQRAQTDLVGTRTQRPHRDWDRTMFGCLLRRYRSSVDCYGDRVSGCSRPGYGISPFGGGHHLLTIELPELTHGWGNSSLGGVGHTQNLKRTQEKGAVTPQETDPDLPVHVQESLARCRSVVACCRVGGTEYGSACMGPFEGGRHYLHCPHHSLASGQITGREHSLTH